MAHPMRTPAEETLIARFAAEKAALPGTATLITPLRETAFRAFEEVGLPHRRVEDWRYTDLRANLKSIAPAAGPANLDAIRTAKPAVEGDGARRLVVANGTFLADLSDLADLEAGLSIRSLAEDLANGTTSVAHAIGIDPLPAGNTAVELNTAFMTDGVVIEVAEGVVIERPLEIVHLVASATPVSTAVRNFVFVGAGARATVIETVESLDAVAHQSNIVTTLSVGDDAALDHIRLQLEPDTAVSFATVTARIGARATLNTFNAALGAGLARAQVFATFTGREAKGGFRGVTLLSGRRHADTTLVVNHDAEACESRELYKAVVDDSAKSVFQGRIEVPSHAQKTDARMMTASLLLSEDAEAAAKPELEIFADDVQCGHGATCGEIDDDLMFYLLSRGIPEAEAESMLILAFLGEAIDEIDNEAVHDALIHRVEDWLKARQG
ncbi:Fe-S cluster assembly protein SufD [Oryzibacter oryziterrae]|uniref:Fe-S cluster assembly protein SufD n=1 Tax=Oryzibacter oryziterrae TaxID=2766474 RepID=UPI001F01298E|nr:Fe-S cluster assembly protein SufD [Oryzibacter oryziterrae]